MQPKHPKHRPSSWMVQALLILSLFLTSSAFAQVDADFNGDPTVGYATLTVTFTDQSTGIPPVAGFTREWDFPGGTEISSNSDKTIVIVGYNTPGLYDVTMHVMSGGKIVDTEYKPNYIEVLTPIYDYGDAPDDVSSGLNYKTIAESNGAAHLVNYQFKLGEHIDAESNGFQSSDALGDDVNGDADDEDGVLMGDLLAGSDNPVVVMVRGGGNLNVWFDWNADGDWEDAGEQVFDDLALTHGDHTLTVPVPGTASLGFTFARFRLSRQTELDYYGEALDGEVEDYVVQIVEGDELDWGDAPDTPEFTQYPTLAVNGGANHPISDEIFLGNMVDFDIDGQPDFFALGDDTDAIDDEDGVFLPYLVPGMMNIVRVHANISTGGTGYLNAWIDFNGNNDWGDPDEQIFTDEVLGDGLHELSFLVPATADTGLTYARFRFGLESGISFSGPSTSPGEVEDYRPQIIAGTDSLDFGDAPDTQEFTSYPTYLVNDGARHPISDYIYLGTIPDHERDGQPTTNADGDDLSDLDDEDGVDLPLSFTQGMTEQIVVHVHGRGNLHVWVDFNANGNWEHPGELAYTGLLDPGDHIISIDVPPAASVGTTYARFRYSIDRILQPNGLGSIGEVEDYVVEIEENALDFGDAPDTQEFTQYPTYLVNNGARHPISQSVYMGAHMGDGEADGQPTSNATGDDLAGTDDEDGVHFPELFIPGQQSRVSITLYGSGTLRAWFDWDQDGTWDATTEAITPIDMNLAPGDPQSNVVEPMVTVPATALTGPTYARFRFSDDRLLGPDGPGSFGEVEDYLIEVITGDSLDFGDAPETDGSSFPTTLPAGARHPISQNIYLGHERPPDGEADGQPHVGAFADDSFGIDDEDGVDISALTVGFIHLVPVRTTGRGILHTWIDLNGNGMWEDPDEKLFSGPLGSGDHTIPIYIPVGSNLGHNYARFRYSNDFQLGPGGPGGYGEVEDYAITILPGDSLDFGDAIPSYGTTLAGDGARHPVSRQFYLGAEMPDAETNGQPSSDADGDDTTDDDDEDGVAFLDPFVPGYPSTIEVTHTGQAALRMWFDWNANGVFDPSEKMYDVYAIFGGTATTPFEINVPVDAVMGDTYARFRFSNDQPPFGPTGMGMPGEVEDYVITVGQTDSLDYGDAPDGFGYNFATLLANDGARHSVTQNWYLGYQMPDAESDGLPHNVALGDDLSGIGDEEGVNLPAFFPGQSAGIHVTVQTDGVNNGYLFGWIDWNGDGDWDDANENIIDGASLPAGPTAFSVNVPEDASLGYLHSRFRWGPNSTQLYSGYGGYGEVEDYPAVVVLDFGDAPESGAGNYPTTIANDGARHPMSRSLYLGTEPDGEFDGQPNATATGDDAAAGDDEDGVLIPVLVPGFLNTAIIEATNNSMAAGYVNAWIDFNGDGDWDDVGEKILNDQVMGTGTHTVLFDVPATATEGETFARFRYSFDSALGVTGLGGVGEVEDYRVLIQSQELDFGDAPDGWVPGYPTWFIHGGPYHRIHPDVFLGSQIDKDTDGQPTDNADGDDNDEADDDDGVAIHNNIVPGGIASIAVNASLEGYFSGWADFNGDGDWTDCGETIFLNTLIPPGNSMWTYPVPDWTSAERIYFRFRYSMGVIPGPFQFAGGSPYYGEVEDYVVTLDEGINFWKWKQPPVKNRESYYDYSNWGWNETSTYGDSIIADNWFCADPRPVTGIRWWGSYVDWDSIAPPPIAPESFHIAIWSDESIDEDYGIGQPEKVVWEQVVHRGETGETVVGSDYHPAHMTKPDSTFEYFYSIPMADWYYQETDSTYYWLTISAMYNDVQPDSFAWGWTTRQRYFNADAIRVLHAESPQLDSLYRQGHRLMPGWDMAFELMTNELGDVFDYGDAPDPDYPTESENNGAHHMIWPDIHLGDLVDHEPEGQPDADAMFDDTDGTDDEDGVEFLSDLVGNSATGVTVRSAHAGVLNAWIDYNGDGDWDDVGEQIFIDMPVIAGYNNLVFNVPTIRETVYAVARFRLSVVGDIRPTGLAIGGEVEDHLVTVSPKTAVEEKEEVSERPGEFLLEQNYPNPFNPETTIPFKLAEPGEVMIVIYDIFGREVRTLIHGQWSAGAHKVVWDGRNVYGDVVSTGMYIYRIQVRSIGKRRQIYNAVKKMIFMK